jgi:hypothetical protein
MPQTGIVCIVKNGGRNSENGYSDDDFTHNTAMLFFRNLNWNFIDAPASTSALTYKIQFTNNGIWTAHYMFNLDKQLVVNNLLEIGA